ncbi:MAG: hypothetical protein ABR536_06600, partial [Solirubrobacterales bacterium]
MEVGVGYLSTEGESAYSRYVGSHPDALISYTLPYRNMLVELLGGQARYAVALREGAVVGVMPLMSTTGAFGTILNSLPYFGSNGGPLSDDRQALDALWAWYSEEAGR